MQTQEIATDGVIAQLISKPFTVSSLGDKNALFNQSLRFLTTYELPSKKTGITS